MSFNLDEYVDVAERIRVFYEHYPEGRLVTADWDVKPDIGGHQFVWVHAKAFRTPDDPLPGDGIAWEPVPGPTQFTKDSELMNAQTAAWGRAIVALGFETKKIASRQEVRARQDTSTAATPATNGTPATVEDTIIHFGKNKGTRLGDLNEKQISWYATQWVPNPEYTTPEDATLKQAAIALHDLQSVPF